MIRFFTLVLRHRYVTLLGLALTTAFFVAQFPRGRLGTDIFDLFLDDPSIKDRYHHMVREFGSDSVILIAFDAADMFTADGLTGLEAAVEELQALDDLDRVTAISTADLIRGTEDQLIVRPYLEDMQDTDEWLAWFRNELANHELYQDLLISRDGGTLAIVCEMTVDDLRAGETLVGLLQELDAILAKHHVGQSGRHMLGFPVNVAETIQESQFNMVRVFPIAVVTVFFVGWVLFRALWPTVLTLGVALLAVVWVLGFAILLTPEINILVTITPVVILVLSFADVIHLTTCYVTAITDGIEKEAAVLQTASEVGPACLFTSLTTLLGFASFAMVPAHMMRLFAFILAFGTAAALFIAVTLVPVLFAIFPAPAPRRRGLSATHGSPIDRMLAFCAHGTARHPIPIALATLAVVVSCAYSVSQLRVETDFVNRFRDSHPLRVAHAFVQARMANANTAEVIIQTPERDGVYDPQFLHAVQEMQRQVLELPVVDSALTLTNLLEVIHREMNPGETGPGELPETRELAAQYVLLYSLGGEEELGKVVNFERNRVRMAVRLNQNGMNATHQAAQAILAIAERTLPPGVHVETTGLMVVFGSVLQIFIAGEINGLITAMITITAVLMFAFRSVRGALGGMIVNFLPMLIYFGTIHWFDEHFDTDYIIIACVCLGIAVDDTIHFLNRYRLELGRAHGDVNEAIWQTFEHTGKPIVQTTLIIFLGFGAFNLCSYTTARAFGAMLGCSLLWALLADLLLLPVLIRAGLVPLRPVKVSSSLS